MRRCREYLGEVSDSYQQKVEEISQQMRASLEAMTQYPVGQHYQEAVHELLAAFEASSGSQDMLR